MDADKNGIETGIFGTDCAEKRDQDGCAVKNPIRENPQDLCRKMREG
jgi:hypothetical protein